MTARLQNWAKNFDYRATKVHWPETLQEIQDLIHGLDRVKPLGTRHSFNDVADTEGEFVSSERLNRVLSLDLVRNQVTVEAGIKYGELCKVLDRNGLALHNLASLPHISVAGACATATHGSGDQNGSLATAVSAIEFVDGTGELRSLSRGHPDFCAAVVSLGALGFVVRMTLDVRPAFEVGQFVFERLPFETVLDHFDDITSCGYSVSLFTRWHGPVIDQVWVKNPSKSLGDFYGATPALNHRHPIVTMSPENCAPQMGLLGPSHERLPHFRMDFTPSSGEELQSEYLIPRQNAIDALRRVNEFQDLIAPLLQVSEIRTVAADDLWLSPCYQQACVGIHFTWKKLPHEVENVIPTIEDALAPFGARPHWGKIFRMPVSDRYARMNDFKAVLEKYDPRGKFRNGYLERVLG